MLDFIAKYWLEFLFGIITLGLTGLTKYFYNLYKKEKQRLEDEAHEKIIKELKSKISDEHKTTADLLQTERDLSKQETDSLKQEIYNVNDKIDVVRDGVLSIQGKQFKNDCRKLLNPDHEITLDEFEEIESDHETYNKMNGNHTGDKLFQMVEQKFRNSLSNYKG